MEELAKRACDLLGYSACYALSAMEELVYAGGFLLIAFGIGLLVCGLVLGWFTG
jgi:hypothetical protein